MTTYTAADVNSWYQAVQFRNSETDPSLVPTVDTYVVQLNSGSVTANQVQQQIIGATYTLTNVNPVIQMYQGLLNRVPDEPGLNYWANQLAGGASDFWVAYYIGQEPEFTSYYGASGNAAVSEATLNLMYNTIFGTNVDAAGKNYWLNLGLTNWQAAYYLSTGTAGDSSMALAINSFQQAQITNTEATSGSLYQYGGYPITSTETLTTGVDIFSANFFDGNLTSNGGQTLNSGDQLTGTNLFNTLDATITSSVTPAKLSNIQDLQITNADSNARTLGLVNATAATNITNDGSVGDLTFTNIGALGTTLGVSNTNSNTTFTFASTAGTQTVGLTLSVAGTDADPANVTLNGIETVNITSAGAKNYTNIISDATTAITARGSEALEFTAAIAGNAAKVTSVDASAMTGAVTLETGALGDSSTAVSVTGGSGNDSLNVSGVTNSVNVDGGAGNDVVTASNINSFDTISGGEGIEDELVITGNNGQVAPGDASSVSSFEILTLQPGAGNTITQDMDAFSGIGRVNAQGAAATVAITDAGADLTALGSIGAAATVSLARKTDTSADSLSVFLGSTTENTVVTNLTLNNEETINVTSQGGANTITNFNAADLVTLNVSGAQNAALGTIAGATNIATVNASASTGAVSFNAAASLANMTVTAGSGALTATTGSGTDSITGGGRSDSLVGNGGNDTILGLGGNDTIDGSAGNDSLVGGDGNDSITAGSGDDYVDGGAGNDIVIVTDYTSADTLDGGAGTNTLNITTAASSTTPEISNFQTVDVTFGGNHTLDLSKSTSTTLVINELTANAQAVAVQGLASGATFRNLDDDDTITLDTAAAATLTVDARIVNTNALTITDAQAVAVTNGGAVNGSFAGVNLDTVNTTSLTVTGGTGGTLATGAIGTSDKVQSLSISSSTAAMTVTVGDMADADSLTSLNVTGAFGNVVVGEIGGTGGAGSGTAEGLATVTVSAASGSAVTLDQIYADTTDSVTDNPMVLTASAANGSSVTFDDITNTYGSITASVSGDGAVNFTGGNGTLAANDITMTRSGVGATTIDAIDAGNDVNITLSGSGAFTLTTVDAEGDLLINGSSSSGKLTVSSTSTVGTSIYGGSASDSIVAGNSNDTRLEGNAGDDTLTGGTGNDIIIGGDGNDSITAGSGVDSLSGGAGNDTFVLGTNLTSADTVDGGTGTNTATLTTAAVSTTPSLTNVQTVDVTFGDNHTLDLSKSTSTTLVINELTANAQAVAVTALASGGTFRNLDDDDAMTIDTAAAGLLTLDQRFNGNNAGSFTVTDASKVTFVNGSSAATQADFAHTTAVTLDTVDTTSVVVTGASVANSTIEIAVGSVVGGDAFLNTNALKTVDITTSTTGATVLVGQIDDADALTSLTVAATNADAEVGVIGTAGTAEVLSSVTATASGVGIDAKIGNIIADTTDSATDNAMTITATAGADATVTLGNVNNQYGSITLNATGQGAVNTGTLTSVDLTLDRSDSGVSTIGGITISNDATLTLAGAGSFTLTAAAVSGDLVIDASGKTGSLIMSANSSTGSATITGGDAADTIRGAAGNDSLIGGAGADSIYSGAGNDTIDAGSSDDTIVMSTYLATGDVIDGGTGNNTLTATIDASRTATISNVQTLAFDMSGGAFNAANTTGATTLTLTSAAAGNAVLTNLDKSIATINQNEDAAVVSFGYKSGAAATVLYDFDASTEAITNTSTTFSNVATLTIDGDATNAVALGSLAGGAALKSLTINVEDGNFNSGNITADNLQTLAVTVSGAGDATLGTLASATALNTITLTSEATANNGDIVVGNIGAGVGGNAAVLQSITISTDINSTTLVNLADIDAENADITTFNINLDGIYGASDIATVTADTISSIDVTTTATGTSFTITEFVVGTSVGDINITNGDDFVVTNGFTLGAAGTVGNVNVTASDTVTIAKIEGISVGNIVASNSTAATTVAFGTVGDTGSTVGDITFSGAGDFSITAGAALVVGDVDTTGVTGTSTVTLSNSTLVGVNMTGDAGIDVFTGTGAADVISVGGAADTVKGGAGADTISVGSGSDRVIFSTAITSDTVSDFLTSGSDLVAWDKSDFNSVDGMKSGQATIVSDGLGAAVANNANGSFTTVLAGDAGQTALGGGNVLNLTGASYASTADVEAFLAGADGILTNNAAGMDQWDTIAIQWYDASGNYFVGGVIFDLAVAANIDITAADISVVQVAQLGTTATATGAGGWLFIA